MTNEKQNVFTTLKEILLEVVPELSEREVNITERLRDLGANSVDRAEILTKTMAALKIRMPLVELGSAENIEGLVDIFVSRLRSS